MAVVEQSLKPDVVIPKKVEFIQDPNIPQEVEQEPDQEFYEAREEEYEDDITHYPISEVIVESTQAPRPEVTLKPSYHQSRSEAGVFCFNCKGSFESYNQFHLHLRKDHNNGHCSDALPEYYYTERNDRSGMLDNKYKHGLRHHKPVTRDISHIQCTLCKAINFATTGDLYAHMIKCASSTNSEGESPIDCPTVFGYGMPPSFGACQYVFPDPAKDRVPRYLSEPEMVIEQEF